MPAAAGAPEGQRPDAVIDACVLFPKSIRGILLYAAADGAFQPAWSDRILSELRVNLKRKIGLEPAAWQRLEGAMRGAFPGALVPEQRIAPLLESMPNHPKDRHVLAAAVAAGAPVVVTANLSDFRRGDLAKVSVTPMHPDAYLCQLLARSPEPVANALAQQAAKMREGGDWSRGQLLGHFKGLGRAQPMAPRFATQAEARLGIRAVAPPEPARSPRSPSRTAARPAPSLGR